MEIPTMKLMAFAAAAACFLGLFAVPALAQDEATAPKEPPARQEAPTVHVLMQTSMGDIVLELNREKAPITVKNFLSYVDKGHYNGTIFHRIISNFMIQGGGFTQDMNQKATDAQIKNEWKNGLKNERGSIAMARLGGQPDSATAQFFVNVENNTFLDQPRDGAAYAVFGKVVSGMDVVDRIRNVRTGVHAQTGMQDVPVEPVVIRTARRMTEEEVAALPSGGKE
jgi:peptidyl-prolyl cis-trans isomerase A (cyclophilin A)